MRIVADTNAVLSGLLWQGAPRQLIDHARAGTLTLHTSLVLLAELAEVIGRAKFVQRILRANLSPAGLVEDYRRLTVLVEPVPLPVPVSRDADDDHVLACALGANAQLIVTGDLDLLVLNAFNGIPIRPASQALDFIAASAT